LHPFFIKEKMSLTDRAKADVLRFTSNPNQWGVELNFIAPAPGDETATVYGTTTKHRIKIDADGIPINAKNASCSVSEKLLTDLGYPVRNSIDEVALQNHRVSWTDSSGALCEYKISQWFPDEKLGLIVCILEDYE
jgi:hypothetical protein